MATDAEVSARQTKNAAWIAAAAAILSAVLALGGTLWSGQVASRSVERQLSGETDRSRAEFLRGQRQVLYGQILQHDQSAADLTLDFFVSTLGGPPATDAHRAAHSAATKSLREGLNRDLSTLRVIGSNEAIIAVQAMSDAHRKYLTATAAYVGILVILANNRVGDKSGLLKETTGARTEYFKQRDKFINAARYDMGNR